MARRFDGSTTKILTGSSASFNVAAATLCAWTRYSANPNAYQTIALYGDNVTFFQILLKSNNTLAYYMATPALQQDGFGSVSTNTWFHVAISYDSTVGLKCWLNGSQVGTTQGPSGSLSVGTKPFEFGADDNNAGRIYTGDIADIGYYNLALSINEIKALANGARPFQIRPTSIIAYWPLYGLASPEPDLGGGAHNGTVTAATKAGDPPVMPFTPRWPQKLADTGPAAFNNPVITSQIYRPSRITVAAY